MTTSKLTLYNGACRILGERRLASLTENRPALNYLNDAWDDGVVDGALEQGYWNFGTRTIRADYDPSIEPEFGYQRAFQKPDDYIRLAAISTDEYFRDTLHDYSDEQGYWFCDHDLLYIKYISNDSEYGGDFALWPQSFQKYIQASLADEVKELVTGNDGKYDRIKKALKDAKSDARSKDVMNRPTKFAPAGSFVRARMTSRVNNDGAA
jgi:hypothetical protein